MKTLFVLAIALLAGGCASYEYDLTQPPMHIGQNHQTSLNAGPLLDHFQTVDNRLVIWIQNPTGEAILLDGQRSVIVDPSGQSIPVRGQTIAPGSFIKLILPPLRYYQFYSPVFIGGDFQYARFRRGGYVWVGPDYYYDEPTVEAVPLFDWPANSDVRVILSFVQKDKHFDQSLTFRRVQVR